MKNRWVSRIAPAALLSAALPLCVSAQTPAPAFDVASVRPSVNPPQRNGPKGMQDQVHTEPGSVVMRGISMTGAIQWAYDVEFYQVIGPDWMHDTRFDILAKAGRPATPEEMRPMMQALLASRFHLAAHRDKKEMQCMALLKTKETGAFQAAEDQGEPSFEPTNGKPMIHFGHMSLHKFASLLSEPMNKPVIDLTGLQGEFNFTLDGTKYAPPPPIPGQPRMQEDETYMIFKALQDELGLKLEPRKLSIDTVVVDKIDKTPTEN